jgi:hypothetical protein
MALFAENLNDESQLASVSQVLNALKKVKEEREERRREENSRERREEEEKERRGKVCQREKEKRKRLREKRRSRGECLSIFSISFLTFPSLLFLRLWRSITSAAV